MNGFSASATCTASETVPANYSADESACLNVAIAITGGPFSCTITNTATFQVLKDFSNDNPAAVIVGLTCTSGTVTVDDPTASEADPADFTVEGFSPGASCTATETFGLPAGYTKDESACVAVPITGGPSSCTITNTLNTAVFNVTKDFTNDGAAIVTVALTCTSGTVTVDDATADEGTPDTADFTVEGFSPRRHPHRHGDRARRLQRERGCLPERDHRHHRRPLRLHHHQHPAGLAPLGRQRLRW